MRTPCHGSEHEKQLSMAKSVTDLDNGTETVSQSGFSLKRNEVGIESNRPWAVNALTLFV